MSLDLEKIKNNLENFDFSELFIGQLGWSHPREVILELSSYFPHILFTLSYYERGQSYYGKSKLINRRYIREIEGDYFGPRGG